MYNYRVEISSQYTGCILQQSICQIHEDNKVQIIDAIAALVWMCQSPNWMTSYWLVGSDGLKTEGCHQNIKIVTALLHYNACVPLNYENVYQNIQHS